jgi:hypothetical protein
MSFTDRRRQQLWPLYYGFALWNPNPVQVKGVYNEVSIGDVGYVLEGCFIRMFNVTLPWDDKSNKTLGKPCRYDLLRIDSDDIAICLTKLTTIPVMCPERKTLGMRRLGRPISES